ncbi:MAG TPA: LysR family transcriptional regulator [Alphaproteobacteria bacterium]|nr:LysR family transcriptional regulator [Alphaproteobacteria bacterium]
MDNRAGEMEVFVQAAQRGSFAAAAKAMQLTPSAVSRSVARLEDRLGVRLFQRTTRALSLTAEGEIYLTRATGLLSDIEEIERSFAADAAEPRGRLRVNASVPFGTYGVIPVLPKFLETYPRMILDLSLSDDVVDLIEERADVAIRIGPLRDTTLRAKLLGRSKMAVVAAPSYLEKHGKPAHPDGLAGHNCLNFNFRRSADRWPFRVDGTIANYPIVGNFLGNSGEVVRLMAVAGVGIARLAHYHIAADLAAGRLVTVLEPFNLGDLEEIHALFVGHERLSLRVRAFLDFLAAHVRL